MKHSEKSEYVNIFDQYFQGSREIIGDRSPAEKRYDNEVIRWLRKGKNIKKAIDKANKKYPVEALKMDITNTAHVAGYYDYLMQHEEITNQIFR